MTIMVLHDSLFVLLLHFVIWKKKCLHEKKNKHITDTVTVSLHLKQQQIKKYNFRFGIFDRLCLSNSRLLIYNC